MYPAGTPEFREHFTELMRWGSWPGAAVLGLVLVTGLMRIRRERRLTSEESGLALSLFLFGVGCLLGASIRGESLAVPAHYHGTVGAVTLAYLLWLRRLAGDLGPASRAAAVAAGVRDGFEIWLSPHRRTCAVWATPKAAVGSSKINRSGS